MCNFSIEERKVHRGRNSETFRGGGFRKERQVSALVLNKYQVLNVTCICLIYFNNYIYHIIIKTL